MLRLAASRGGPRNALGYRPEPEVLPLPAETSREAAKCCAWQHQGGGPRNALGYRPEPEVLPLPAETSREAPKCCAWQRSGTVQSLGPETRSGTVQSLKSSAAPGSIKAAGGAKPSAAPGSIKGGGAPKRARVPSRAWQHQGGGPNQVLRLAASREGGNALLYRPEPEVLPLPAETSREAPKCCAWQRQEGGPETRSGTVQSLKCCPCQQKRAARLPSAAPGRSAAPASRNEP